MEKSAKLRVKRTLAVLALGVAFLTVAPVISSLIIISSAWSDRSDVPLRQSSGMTIVEKNGETPAWMADLIERSPEAAGVVDDLDPDKGLAI